MKTKTQLLDIIENLAQDNIKLESLKLKVNFMRDKKINEPTHNKLKKEISQLNSVITGLNSVLVKKSKEIEAYKTCYSRLININAQLTKVLSLMDVQNSAKSNNEIIEKLFTNKIGRLK